MLTSVLMSAVMPSAPKIEAQTDPPIACQPKGLTPAQRRRQTELLGIVRGKIQKTVEFGSACVTAWFDYRSPRGPSREGLCCPLSTLGVLLGAVIGALDVLLYPASDYFFLLSRASE
jgi:hypothetical protein